jgi:hypothetical protein
VGTNPSPANPAVTFHTILRLSAKATRTCIRVGSGRVEKRVIVLKERSMEARAEELTEF